MGKHFKEDNISKDMPGHVIQIATPTGAAIVGEYVRSRWELKGYDQKDLKDKLIALGRHTTDPQVSRFIDGTPKSLDISFIVFLVRLNRREPFMVNPVTGSPYEIEDLFDAACGLIDLTAGREDSKDEKGGCNP